MSMFISKSISKYVVSITLLVFLFSQMDLSALWTQSKHFNIWLLLLALVLVICQILFLNLRWHHLINTGQKSISFETSSLINIAGYFANVLFITSVGGILAKSALAVRHGLSVTEAVFATFLDRFMTLFALLVFSALGLPFLFSVIDNSLLAIIAFLVLGIITFILMALISLRTGLLKNFILSNRKRSRIVAILRNTTGNFPLVAKTVFYSIAAQGTFILSVFALSLGLNNGHQEPYFIEFIALMPVLMLISALPISFGGWGVREGAFITGLSLLGFSMESAFFLSVQIGLVTLIAPFFVGIPLLFKTDIRSFIFKGSRKTA